MTRRFHFFRMSVIPTVREGWQIYSNSVADIWCGNGGGTAAIGGPQPAYRVYDRGLLATIYPIYIGVVNSISGAVVKNLQGVIAIGSISICKLRHHFETQDPLPFGLSRVFHLSP